MTSTENRLWAITSYFNPVRYLRRLQNYRTFRQYLTVPLITVELSFGDVFELQPGDADRLIQIQGGDVMFQKERLLNVALSALPPECEAVAWLDCDVLFDDPWWPHKAYLALADQAVLQPYDRVLETGPFYDPQETAAPDLVHRGRSWAAALTDPGVPADLLALEMRGLGYSTGLAWVARRAFLERHGMYDACVMGSGVRALPGALRGRFDDSVRYVRMGPAFREHYIAWAEPVQRSLGGKVGFLPGSIRHLWHGDLRNRRYEERHAGLERYGFDPTRDITVEESGCFRWSSGKSEMHEFVRSYFLSRREDAVPEPETAE